MRHLVPTLVALVLLAACDAPASSPDAARGLDGSVAPDGALCSGPGPICVSSAGECVEPGCLGPDRWQCPIGLTPRSRDSVSCAVQLDGGVTDTCPSDFVAAEGTPCAELGRFCGTCTDPCSFCNLLNCEEGIWVRLEAAPPPGPCVSFACGDRRCDAVTQYCAHTLDDTGGPDLYGCVAYPADCRSCACLGGDRCEGDESTGITVTSGGG
jgi:hypothetical protein